MADWPEMEVGEPATGSFCSWHDVLGSEFDLVATVYGSTPAQALSRARAVAALGEMEALLRDQAAKACRRLGLPASQRPEPCDCAACRSRALLARLEAADGE